MASVTRFSLRLSLVRHLVKNSTIRIGLLGCSFILMAVQVALMSVQSPHDVCKVMLEGVANTGIVQACGKSSRVRRFKGLILFSQGFVDVGKNTCMLTVGLLGAKDLSWVL